MGEIIVLEGIDGVGKTTIAQKLLEQMKMKGENCTLLSKKNPQIENEKVKEYASLLQEIIWAGDKEDRPWDFLDETQWILQLTLWYSVLKNEYVIKAAKEYDYVILDGWSYKMYSRWLLNKKVPLGLVREAYDLMDLPAKVFLIDNDPEVCWTRRKSFKPTEIASYGEKVIDYRAAFVEYQGMVRRNLLRLSENKGWLIVDARGKNIESTVEEIERKI